MCGKEAMGKLSLPLIMEPAAIPSFRKRGEAFTLSSLPRCERGPPPPHPLDRCLQPLRTSGALSALYFSPLQLRCGKLLSTAVSPPLAHLPRNRRTDTLRTPFPLPSKGAKAVALICPATDTPPPPLSDEQNKTSAAMYPSRSTTHPTKSGIGVDESRGYGLLDAGRLGSQPVFSYSTRVYTNDVLLITNSVAPCHKSTRLH